MCPIPLRGFDDTSSAKHLTKVSGSKGIRYKRIREQNVGVGSRVRRDLRKELGERLGER